MSRAKSKVAQHVFLRDPGVPPDSRGRGACSSCHLVGEPDDAHHTLPTVPEQAQVRARYDHDDEEP